MEGLTYYSLGPGVWGVGVVSILLCLFRLAGIPTSPAAARNVSHRLGLADTTGRWKALPRSSTRGEPVCATTPEQVDMVVTCATQEGARSTRDDGPLPAMPGGLSHG